MFDRMRSAPGESDQRRRERAAYHEAAHAVLIHTADMPFIKVEITPTGNKCTGEGADFLTRFGVPQAGGLVVRPGQHARTIRAECDGYDSALMPFKDMEFITR